MAVDGDEKCRGESRRTLPLRTPLVVDGRDLQAGRKAWWTALGKTANAIEWGSHQPSRTVFDVAVLNLGAKAPVTLLV